MGSEAETRQIVDAITGAWRTRLICEGIRAGLIDRLDAQPRTAGEMARELDLHPETTLRILRALAALGLCHHQGGDVFTASGPGERLRGDRPDSLRGMALLWGDRIWKSLETIGETLRTGKPGRGNGDFEGMHADPAASDAFNRAMAEQSRAIAQALVRTLDFSGYRQVIDLGGGYGAVLAEILRANPDLRGQIYDLAAIGEGALRYLDEAGVGARAAFVGGSFFESVPAGADCLVIKYILHDWPDADCRHILANCRAALAPGASAIIVERIVADRITPQDESVMRTDLVMMPISGRERTLAEFHALLREGGFTPGEAHPLIDGCWAIESRAN
ncbi:methyltransferase [Sphingobium lignivorans]|uniref:O-methyltransferase C-terminal domain-containing protein n=1 Tax=Sphingobium lignivorans TaxID=2735886 RepID=A0ABR6NLX7_9SPHN|nr:methyltransferase [Sphingobium lignivorans]MBB5987518.1 hypothetical protein [Sphingobium lignivorans]